MDLTTQARVVAELNSLSEELEALVGALLAATQRGLVVENLTKVLDEIEGRLHQVGFGTT